MVQSMTGYGKAVAEFSDKKITVEIRSLNSKSLDLNTRLPFLYKEKELEIRKLLSEKLQRGKVDFSINTESNAVNKAQQINPEIIKAYISEFKQIVPDASDAELLTIVMRLPDVMTFTCKEIEEDEWNQAVEMILKAIENLTQFRLDEGKVLEQEFIQRNNSILNLLEQVEPFEKERIETLKERFIKNLGELTTEYDQNRFEQELIYYLEKLDITEEKVRLKNHCEYFLQTLSGEEFSGKKLGFITQEIGREINTLGSKSNHSGMQKLVVQMKDELEKMKEQVLNIL
ncbi:YicC/YloC family endoribonuclease [Moheibacter sediminis]|uniref:TIGR00255 family protein n=1 Tax=Moheibacter sediminis TaxID=1434700 RepID=A0A1W1Y7B2_9FLAO|nr:YicC/YloC family endoribonuclease [Moheibacter sediminis]SMC32090.1 TIGR00255 family protein [Moheibacter sediminis]